MSERHIHRYGRASPPGQRGAALAVTLILLLVMTLIGVSAMEGAVLEIKMATTMQQEEVALRRAERTLLAAEETLEALVNDPAPFEFATPGDAYYRETDNLNARVVDWSAIVSLPGPVNSANGLDDDDAYVIEYRGMRQIPGESQAVGGGLPLAGSVAYLFRNTTRSAEGRNAVRIIESVYATEASP